MRFAPTASALASLLALGSAPLGAQAPAPYRSPAGPSPASAAAGRRFGEHQALAESLEARGETENLAPEVLEYFGLHSERDVLARRLTRRSTDGRRRHDALLFRDHASGRPYLVLVEISFDGVGAPAEALFFRLDEAGKLLSVRRRAGDRVSNLARDAWAEAFGRQAEIWRAG